MHFDQVLFNDVLSYLALKSHYKRHAYTHPRTRVVGCVCASTNQLQILFWSNVILFITIENATQIGDFEIVEKKPQESQQESRI